MYPKKNTPIATVRFVKCNISYFCEILITTHETRKIIDFLQCVIQGECYTDDHGPPDALSSRCSNFHACKVWYIDMPVNGLKSVSNNS